MISESGITIKRAIDYLESEIIKMKEIIDILKEKLDTIDNKLSYLIDYETGNWEIKNKQMIFKNREGKILAKFDLFNKDGEKSEIDVYKRVRVE